MSAVPYYIRNILNFFSYQVVRCLPTATKLCLVNKVVRDLASDDVVLNNPHVVRDAATAFVEAYALLLGDAGPLHMSYSQSGEDIIASYVFRNRGIMRPSYLDIGAHNPLLFSNTALFYAMGSSGVNVEANPDLIDAFRLKRPRDKNICCAVTEKTGPCTLVVPDEGETLASVATLAAEHREVTQGRRVSVPGRCLREILDEYCGGSFPDFLSLDVEGMDLEILKQIPFESTKPKVICVETVSYSASGHGRKDDSIASFLEAVGYFNYADTNINTIFVHSEFWKSA